MDRRAFLGALGLLATPRWVEAQLAVKGYRLGILGSGSPTSAPAFLDAFRQGLRDFAWVEGQGITIEYRFAEGRLDRLPGLAAELVRSRVDVIVAAPTPSAVAAKNATASIPIVMVAAAQPVELGLIKSFARPGGNVTGVAFSVDMEIFGKGLELLTQAVANVRLVAILWNPGNPGSHIAMRDVKAAAQSLRVQLQVLPVRGPDDFESAFGAMAKARTAALLVVGDSMFNLHRTRLADLALKNRLPSMHSFANFVEAGGLMSYGANIPAIYRRSAAFVDKILKGAKPADLPVEQPTKFDLVINLKTAKALGLTIPPALLQRADQVIE